MDFFNQIKSELQIMSEKATNEQWSDHEWTIGVKKSLVKVGRQNGYLTAANQVDSDKSKEWLYDVVWYQSDQAGHMTDVPLVAESEWGDSSAVKEDFEKLLVSRSRYRVMIFQTVDKEAQDLIREMKLWIFKFLPSAINDRYIFAGWDRDHWDFEFYTHEL